MTRRCVTRDGDPPATSFWVGASRESLQRAVAARRAQQRIPSEGDLRFDPLLSATAALLERKSPKDATK